MTPLAMFSPEMRLLLLAAGEPTDAGVMLAHARAVRSWPLLVRLAERERACGTLWRHVAPHADGLDVDGMATLRRVAMVEGFRGQRQRARLVGAVRALHGVGIPVALLKGAALATTVYAGFGERAMSDLDVLVPAADGPRALATLLAADWRHDGALFPMEMYAAHHHLPPLADARHASVMLEAHVALLPFGSPFNLDTAEVWRDARPVGIDGVEVLAPSPVHLALHACLHFTWSHALTNGAWRTLRDLRILVASGQVAWEAFVPAAQRVGGGTCCYWPLAIGHETGVLRVPEWVLAALRPRLPTPLLALLTRHFLLQLFVPDVPCPSARLRRTLWTVAVQPPRTATSAERPWSANERFARFGWDAPARTRRERVAAWRRYLQLTVAGSAEP